MPKVQTLHDLAKGIDGATKPFKPALVALELEVLRRAEALGPACAPKPKHWDIKTLVSRLQEHDTLPISGEIEAATLAEAVEKFPEAINAAVKKLQEDMLKMQQEQANKIVTPDELRGGNDIII